MRNEYTSIKQHYCTPFKYHQPNYINMQQYISQKPSNAKLAGAPRKRHKAILGSNMATIEVLPTILNTSYSLLFPRRHSDSWHSHVSFERNYDSPTATLPHFCVSGTSKALRQRSDKYSRRRWVTPAGGVTHFRSG